MWCILGGQRQTEFVFSWHNPHFPLTTWLGVERGHEQSTDHASACRGGRFATGRVMVQLLWAGRYPHFCFYYLSSLLSANTKKSRRARWRVRTSCVARGGGVQPSLALQMCMFVPPASPAQVRLVLTECDSPALDRFQDLCLTPTEE